MKRFCLNVWLCLSLWAMASCVEEYELPETANGEGLLVVDGGMNVEEGTAQVKLTRSQSLADKTPPKPETGANVWIEYGQGAKINLTGNSSGMYSANGLSLDYGTKYKLRIKTKVGKEYASTEVSTVKTPPIDEITWDVEGENVNIRVTTHDPTNAARYYRWEFEDTYEYSVPYFTRYILDENGKLKVRTESDSTYQNCWKYGASSNILVGSTTQLENAVVNKVRIATINGNSQKLSMRYSMLVKQHAISREEHQYWQILRKNTEEVGSLFDAQPSEIKGNVSNLNDPNEPVLGYFSVRSVTTKRFFLSKAQLAQWNFRFQKDCPFIKVPISADGVIDSGFLYSFVHARYVVVDWKDEFEDNPAKAPNNPWMLSFSCSDCREMGGTGKKPAFW
ncbi:DUF4249 domain-containing protein [Rufibacter roseus]|uniref:DUF4249 domain-containing protein n=1 Tax=Rufibacter roseus TaxID=1567108 RepID=A0ABW2DHT9_9BACT|nr:DUF4249 domain-containing protein [Rufibacter roseus]